MYIYVYIYNFGKKTIQNKFTWYLKFHAGGPKILKQVQRSSKNLQYNDILNMTPFT